MVVLCNAKSMQRIEIDCIQLSDFARAMQNHQKQGDSASQIKENIP